MQRRSRVRVATGVLVAVVLAAALAGFTSESTRAESTPPLTAFGQRAVPVVGVRPLLTILLDFSDVPFSRQHSADFYRRLLYRSGANIARFDGFMGAMSNERFSFASAGIVGPYRLPDDPASPADESTADCIIQAVGCSTTDRTSRAQAIRAAAADGFDFRRYDRNVDGFVTDDELGVLMIVSAPEGDLAYTYSRTAPTRGLIGWARMESAPGLVHLERFQHGLSGDILDTVRAADGSWPPAGYERFTAAAGVWVHGAPGPGLVELRLFYSPSRMDYALLPTGATPRVTEDGRPADYRDVRSAGGWIDTTPTGEGMVALQEYFSTGDAGTWGAVRSTEPGCVPAGTVSVCVSVPSVGEAVGASTLAHELTHAIGVVWEVYGSSCRSQNFTTMTCTSTRSADNRSIVGLDPYARLHLGWLEPRVLPVSARGCFSLTAATTTRTPVAAPEAYLLFDPRRGTDEPILLEYRWRRPGSYDADPFRSGPTLLPDEGLAVWVVKKDAASGFPLNLAAYDAPASAGLQDNAVFLSPPDPGTLGEPARGDGLWSGGSEIRPRFIDGTPSGAVIRIAPFRPGDPTIRFGLNQTCPAPVELLPSARHAFDACRSTAVQTVCSLRGPLFIATRRTSVTTDPASVGSVSWTVKPKRHLKGTLQIEHLSSKSVMPRKRTLVARLRGSRAVTVRTTFRAGTATGVAPFDVVLRYVPARGEPRWKKTVTAWVTIGDRASRPAAAERAQLLGPEVAPNLPPIAPPPGLQPPPPQPDLVVSSLTKNSVTIRNQGTAHAASFTVTVSVNAKLVRTFGANGLSAGSATILAFGACYIGAIDATADSGSTVAESDENNNGAQTMNAKCP